MPRAFLIRRGRGKNNLRNWKGAEAVYHPQGRWPLMSILYLQEGGRKAHRCQWRWQRSDRGHTGAGRFLWGRLPWRASLCGWGQPQRSRPARYSILRRARCFKVLHEQHATFRPLYYFHAVSGNVRIEEDLIDQPLQFQRENGWRETLFAVGTVRAKRISRTDTCPKYRKRRWRG